MNAGYACTMSAGVDPDDKFTFEIVIIILIVKLLHDNQCFGIVEVGVDDIEIGWKFSRIM